ncbi:hypothetical protein T4A_5622 [Trichinella pseudospiralis]|uniref:Uncharacterized protein n=1 Tax=Trichinella pseudospiralis TaxID=6337 RepID=A0A0V1AMD2_TRIPS|nr:hypothetical protein T4A_5622 [Trichinella pseudospiralis]
MKNCQNSVAEDSLVSRKILPSISSETAALEAN